jgi:hypothetical protein
MQGCLISDITHAIRTTIFHRFCLWCHPGFRFRMKFIAKFHPGMDKNQSSEAGFTLMIALGRSTSAKESHQTGCQS